MTIKNYFAYLLMFYIAATFVFATGENVFITRIINIVFLGSFLIYFFSHSTMKLYIPKFLWFYIFFIIFSFLSMFWSIDITSTVNKSIIIALIAINLVFLYNISKHFQIEKYILYGILLGSFYNYLIAFDIIEFVSKASQHFKFRFVGTTVNPNVTAIYMLFSLIASVILLQNTKEKIFQFFLIVNIPLSLYVIILTASKKGIVFGLLLLFIYLLYSLKTKKSFFYIISIFIGLIYIVESGLLMQIAGLEHVLYRFDAAASSYQSNAVSGSTYERITLIQTAYEVFSKDFGTILFGTGQQTFYLQNQFGLYAHNNYMEIIANLGLIGVVLFYSIYIYILKDIASLEKVDFRYFLMGFVFILFLMDNAMVSYSFKATFFMFIYISIYVENKKENYAKN